jgi:HD-GYP domain-containing protein (c-di-GMP phosphodiesterase class II)
MDRLERLVVELEERIPGTAGHSRRVSDYARDLARRMGLSAAEATRIARAGTVHDVGKTCLPGAVLSKPGPLDPREQDLVRGHAAIGAAMVGQLGDTELTSFVRHHHERFDGSGYPDRLAGTAIPLGARILAVADTFDALTSNRPYRQSLTHGQALELLEAEAGTQLDPEVVTCFGAGRGMLQAA